MVTKEIYSIRINKDDEKIRNYLEQFPISKQTKALKALLKFGVEKLEEDYAHNQAFEKLQETIKGIYAVHEEKLDEIKSLLFNLQVSDIDISKEQLEDNDGELLNEDKAKKQMEEALSMFMGF